MVSFGIPYVCNDNLVERFKTGAPLNSIEYCDPTKLVRYYYVYEGPLGYLDLSVFEPPKQKATI
jgi:hypothetical protein